MTPGDAAGPRAAAGRQPRPGAEGGHQRGRDVVPLVHRQGELGLVHTQHTVVILTSDWSLVLLRGPAHQTEPGHLRGRGGDQVQVGGGYSWKRRLSEGSRTNTITEKAPIKGWAARRHYAN